MRARIPSFEGQSCKGLKPRRTRLQVDGLKPCSLHSCGMERSCANLKSQAQPGQGRTPHCRPVACAAQAQELGYEEFFGTTVRASEHSLTAVGDLEHSLYTQDGQHVYPNEEAGSFQADSELLLPSLPAAALSRLLLSCSHAQLAPPMRWVQAVLDNLVSKLEEQHAAAAAAGVVGASSTDSSTVHDPALAADVMLLPRVLASVASSYPGQAMYKVYARATALLSHHVGSMAHAELASYADTLLVMQQHGGSPPVGEGAAQCAAPLLQQRAMQLEWHPQHIRPLVKLVCGCTHLGHPVTASWLAAGLRGMGQGELVTSLTGQQVLDLAAAMQPFAHAAAAWHEGELGAPPHSGAVQGRAAMTRRAQEHEAAASCWLLYWLHSTTQQVVTRQANSMTTQQLLATSALLHQMHHSAFTCPSGSYPCCFGQDEAEECVCVLPDVEVAEQLVASELVGRLLEMPLHELAHIVALLPDVALPHEQQAYLLRACLPRLQDNVSWLQPQDAIPLVLFLAKLHEQQHEDVHTTGRHLVGPLLAHSTPLLASCQTHELVHLLSAVARFGVTSTSDWQAMYFTVLRHRLPILEAEDLARVLGCVSVLELTPDALWVDDVFSTTRKLLPDMDADQLADVVWWLSLHAPCMDWLWAPVWEHASRARLKDMSPCLLAASIKALCSLGYRPGQAWMNEFLDSVQARLFAPGAAQGFSLQSVEQTMAQRAAGRALAPLPPVEKQADVLPCLPVHSDLSTSGVAPSASPQALPGHGPVTVDVLMVLIDALTYNRIQPGRMWMDDFTCAIRCRMSLLSSPDLSNLLLFIAGAAYRPSPEWWEDYLTAAQAHLPGTGVHELSTSLAMLQALDVRPNTEWLDAWCSACKEKLCLFLPHQLHQVLSHLAVCGHTPSTTWLRNCVYALEHHGWVFEPGELVRCIAIVDRMGVAPSPRLLEVLYSEVGLQGISHADPAVLAQLMWTLQAVDLVPRQAWLEAYISAAQAALPKFSRLQLESVMAGMLAVCARVQHSVSAQTSGSAAGPASDQESTQSGHLSASVSSFTLVAREWLV